MVQTLTDRVCTVRGAITALSLVFISGEAWRWLRFAPQWSATLQAGMTGSWTAFMVGQVAVAASGILPASLIAIMAGAAFGLVWGVAISAASTMLGGWLAFLLSRSFLRGFIAHFIRRHPAMVRLDQGMTQEGWRLVMLLRVSPIMPFAITSYGLGLTRISQRDFLLGTLASLPSLAGYVAIGALGQQGFTPEKGGMVHWAIMLAGAAVIIYALTRLQKAMKRFAST